MSELLPVQAIDYVPSFAIQLSEADHRLQQFQEFIKSQMHEGEDYGTIPGTSKPTLLKPGAEKLANIFGFAARFEEVRTIEDWDKGLFFYTFKCFLENKRTGQIEAECVASCNSREDKYYWRIAERTCPTCRQATVFKSKEEGGGWFCWRKRGGCGATFSEGDEAIESQQAGKIPNPDPYSLINTFQKMAQKRALIGAVLIATRASGIFTQDLEDLEANGVAIKGETEKPKGKKSEAKGKVSSDPMSRLWDYAKSHGFAEGQVQQALNDTGRDPEKALIILQEYQDASKS